MGSFFGNGNNPLMLPGRGNSSFDSAENSIRGSSSSSSSSVVPIIPRRNDPFQDPIRVIGLVLVTLTGLAGACYFVESAVSSQSEFFGTETNGKARAYDASLLIDACTDAVAVVTALSSAWIVNGGRVGSGPLFRPAWYLHRSYMIVEGLEWTTGFGPPYEGDDFEVGSQQFTAVYGLFVIQSALMSVCRQPLCRSERIR